MRIDLLWRRKSSKHVASMFKAHGLHLHSGKWFLLTGNHVGVLLASHLFDSFGASANLSKISGLTTAVSSGMLEKMANAKGIQFKETLTGFKWMANVARDLEKTGQTVPFAYEEALGYMFPSVCYDKDGITAAAVFLAAEAKWRAQGLTVYEKLQQLFAQFGHHETLNNYFRSPNPELTLELFRGIRSGSFLVEKKFGTFKILRWRDLTEGYDSASPDDKPDLPEDPTSQMLTLWLEGGVRFTFRGSGTEPKVKCRSIATVNVQSTNINRSLHRELWRLSRRRRQGRLRYFRHDLERMGPALHPFHDSQCTAPHVIRACYDGGVRYHHSLGAPLQQPRHCTKDPLDLIVYGAVSCIA